MTSQTGMSKMSLPLSYQYGGLCIVFEDNPCLLAWLGQNDACLRNVIDINRWEGCFEARLGRPSNLKYLEQHTASIIWRRVSGPTKSKIMPELSTATPDSCQRPRKKMSWTAVPFSWNLVLWSRIVVTEPIIALEIPLGGRFSSKTGNCHTFVSGAVAFFFF